MKSSIKFKTKTLPLFITLVADHKSQPRTIGPRSALVSIVFAFTTLLLQTHVNAVPPFDTFYGTGAGNNTCTASYLTGIGYEALSREE